ncbi:MAG: site-specific integrase [Desulfobulbaceae bacterium]|nr:site-specific integrase [Desulfobulbaceae bacterium]
MGFWKDKERKDWCYKFQHQGKQYGSRGFKTKKEAIAAREKHRQNLIENTKLTQKSMGFREVASLYLDDAKIRYARKTYEYKAYVFRSFLGFHKDHQLIDITPIMIDTYLKSRPTNHNYNVHRKELSCLFNYAIKKLKIIISNPVTEIDKLPHLSCRKRIPSKENVTRLIAAADVNKERPFLICILNLVARVDEILRLTWEDVDFKSRTVTRWTKKRQNGNYEPIIAHMNNDLYVTLSKLYEERCQDRWVFYNEKTSSKYNNRRKMLYGINKRAGIAPPIHYHELRHFVASILANTENVSKKTISEILGHKSLSTTEIYLHSIEGAQKEAIESLEGKFDLQITE